VLVSGGRVGISTWTGPPPDEGGPREDDVVDLEAEEWPPCPVCARSRLRRDPNSTDLLFTDDLPTVGPPARRAARRRHDRDE
jgi:hypothetical protein